ncbi:MAG: OmpA family protein [Pseudomonadota bacterium]
MRSLFMVIAFAVAGAAAVATAMSMVSRLEATSSEKLLALFEDEGLDWVEVRIDGLQVELAGSAPDEGTRFRAVTLAGQIVDATHVIDAMAVDPGRPVRAPDFSLEILRNDTGVSLIGLAPMSLDRQDLNAVIDGLAEGGEVTDLLQTADYPVPEGWEPALAYALEALADLPRSKISVSPGRVFVTAISDSAEQKKAIEARLQRTRPSSVLLTLDVSAPRPVITPFTLRFILDENGARFDACSAFGEAGRARILAAAEAAGLEQGGECRVGLGAPSPRWAEAVSQALAALAELGGGSITFSDADVTLIAAEGIDERRFEAVVGVLEGALPEVFSLNATLPEQNGADGNELNAASDLEPEFGATLSDEGLLKLRGRVADDRQRDAVESYARGRFAGSDVEQGVRAVAGMPEGWAARVFAGLDALSYLDSGELVVKATHVEISGETNEASAKDEIARILGDALEDRGTFAIDVAYIEIVEPEIVRPSPRECVDTINAILADQKITFAPGSADINREARGSLDRISELMRDCAAVPMEIAGHTDSQGREIMNLGLSQRRAEAVLEALMARRVLVSNLTARGYGESIPVADNETEEGREANRRIEFTLRVTETDGENEEASADVESDGDAEAVALVDDAAPDTTADEDGADTGLADDEVGNAPETGSEDEEQPEPDTAAADNDTTIGEAEPLGSDSDDADNGTAELAPIPEAMVPAPRPEIDAEDEP